MNHTTPIRVYYENTDAGGVVYHAQYLNFAERARTEMLRALGYENAALKREQGILFVVRHIEADYLKPAFLDDLLEVRSSVILMKNSSFVMKQSIFCHKNRSEQEHDMVANLRVTLVCVDAGGLKPVRLPDEIKNGFERYYEGK